MRRTVVSKQLSVISGQLDRFLNTVHRILNTDHRLLITDHRLLITDHRILITDHRILITDHRLLNTDHRSLITDHRLLITGFTALALWFCNYSHASLPEASLPESHLALFQTYCFECHDSVIEEGEVDLETISFNISEDLETAETWQKVLNALNSGEMPPDDEPQIPNSEKTALLDDLSNQLAATRKIMSDSGGKITMRRLNRREYQNTMHELLGVEVDVNSLPEDAAGNGFDTHGSSQFISSDQIEQYLKIGRKGGD